MIWKIAICVLGTWCIVYTVSYGVFEYKRKNPLGAWGVFALCALIAAGTVGIVIF